MKLLTHNMLTSKCLKNVQSGYPLNLIFTEIKKVDVEYNEEFVKRMIPKLDYNVLRDTAALFSIELPEEIPEDNEEFWRRAHHALMEIEIVEGELICPETGRKFPIKNGIPNMLCNEDEVQ